MPHKLQTLAVEIVELVAGVLELTDQCSLRLVCREVNRKILHSFASTGFATVKTNLSSHSLQKLKNISETEEFRNNVRTLLIKQERCDSYKGGDSGRGLPWPRQASGNLQAQAPGFQTLQDIILDKLVNCRSFHIHNLNGMDGLYDNDFLVNSDAIGIILGIVANTGLPVKSFFVDFARQVSRVETSRLQMPLYQTPKFISGWVHLKELRLEQQMTPDAFGWAMDLILHAPGLRILSLNFQFALYESFLSQLSSSDTLQGLEEFRLGCASVTVEMISKLLFPCRESLRTLSFWVVSLEWGSTWEAMLRRLGSDLPRLNSISLFALTGHDLKSHHVMFPTLTRKIVVPGTQGRKFQLRYKRWKWAERVFGVSYHGPKMDVAIEILANSVEYL